MAKSYQPIGLLNTLRKLFSALVAADLSYLAEKHNLLPPNQFSGRPGRCTTDAMHLIAQKIKDTWRAKKVALILFLDIQAAFPNTVKERLLHNMKSRQVPTPYICLHFQIDKPDYDLTTSSLTQSTFPTAPLRVAHCLCSSMHFIMWS